MPDKFLKTPCDEGNFQGKTWRDFLLSKENDEGVKFEMVTKDGKEYLGGMYGTAIEEAVKAELREDDPIDGAVGEIMELLEEEMHAVENVIKAAELTEETTKKYLESGQEDKLPVWE
eukprot:gnl/TRDRNA2_/TRDRNA2_76770_c0_seq3.p1 gnl/TRDRNA2_/TRDRNA2_76770_c0~~gnl/TRDRNA2_/TRDRNA2_76770_c0_seq3.p1  ORF type:complete len:117 (+),score=42.11 gnl/TRDRNA2_/TRDRNA2_76770_c0_seq3:103-453(+)